MVRPDPSIEDLCVLVVEDNYVLAQSMKWALQGLGCRVVGPAPTTQSALDLLAKGGIDAAILDIDLQGKVSTPVARKLAELGLPFLFLTGYDGATILPRDFHEFRCLSKPVDPESLAAALLEECDRSRPARRPTN